jgi:hypothetical protein
MGPHRGALWSFKREKKMPAAPRPSGKAKEISKKLMKKPVDNEKDYTRGIKEDKGMKKALRKAK